MKAQRSLICAAALLAHCLTIDNAQGATFHVRKDGSGDFTSIQACVNAMSSGDICIVGPGVYEERIHFPTGKSGSTAALTTLKTEKAGNVEIQGIDTSHCNYLRIEGFNISVPPSLTGWTDGVGIAVRSSNVEIVGNYLHDIHYAAVSGHGNNISVQSNHVFSCAVGINISGNGWLVERNEIERTRRYSQINDAAGVRWSGADHVIRGNHLFGTIPAEIDGISVAGFKIFDNPGGAQHIVIENNILEGFYHDGVALDGFNRINSFDLTIRNNLFLSPQSSAVTVLRGVKNVKIYNNTIINPEMLGVRISENSAGEVKNNIFFSNKSGITENAVSSLTYSSDATSTIVAGRNLLYLATKTINQNTFPNDIVNKDPLFVSIVSKNYRIRPGSPALNAAATLEGFNYDIYGTQRPQGTAWDIGAYESPVNGVRPAPPSNFRITAQ